MAGGVINTALSAIFIGSGLELVSSTLQIAPGVSGVQGVTWGLGEVTTGSVTLDTTRYVVVTINGVPMKLLVAN